MSSNSENNKRIAKNTIALYFRQIITMGVALFTSRIVLQTLGVTDYGINNVVGGVVGMFVLLSGTLKDYGSVAECRTGLAAFFERYNTCLEHQALGYRYSQDVYLEGTMHSKVA